MSLLLAVLSSTGPHDPVVIQAESEERWDQLCQWLQDSLGDLTPLFLGIPALFAIIALTALVVLRSRKMDRYPRLRSFLGRPLKVRSRRDLAPHPSPLSPLAGQIPLLLATAAVVPRWRSG